MKERALRRHQQRVAKLRHARIVWRSCPWYWDGTLFHTIPEPGWRWVWHRKPWQQVCRCTMNGEPKHWQKVFNLQPSRIRQNQILRDMERGIDPDTVRRWPDYRRPHIYYW